MNKNEALAIATQYAEGHAHGAQAVALGDTAEVTDIRSYLATAGTYPAGRIVWFARGLADGIAGTRSKVVGA